MLFSRSRLDPGNLEAEETPSEVILDPADFISLTVSKIGV